MTVLLLVEVGPTARPLALDLMQVAGLSKSPFWLQVEDQSNLLCLQLAVEEPLLASKETTLVE